MSNLCCISCGSRTNRNYADESIFNGVYCKRCANKKGMSNPRTCAGPKPAQLLSMDLLKHRPCEVDGRPALFHRWVEEDRAILNIEALVTPEDQARLAYTFREGNICPPGCKVDVLRETFALVEYQDGAVAKVDPVLVRFLGEEG